MVKSSPDASRAWASVIDDGAAITVERVIGSIRREYLDQCRHVREDPAVPGTAYPAVGRSWTTFAVDDWTRPIRPQSFASRSAVTNGFRSMAVQPLLPWKEAVSTWPVISRIGKSGQRART